MLVSCVGVLFWFLCWFYVLVLCAGCLCRFSVLVVCDGLTFWCSVLVVFVGLMC